MSEFTKKELNLLKRLNTPAKVQDFLNGLKFNFERKGQTCRSPLSVLRRGEAHCLEGAILSAYALSLHGFHPYVMCLKTAKKDLDHCIAPFEINGYWGAISKTNHNVLRYRDPVYKSIRELAMSYFHEYFLESGEKTLRKYSDLLDLNIFEPDWICSEEDLWGIDQELDNIKYHRILPPGLKKIRKADKIEIRAGNTAEFKR